MKAILTYHSIDDTGSVISTPPAVFREHHRWLVSRRVKTLSLDEIVAAPDEGDDAVAVTFDDGFLNGKEPIRALLADGVPVTIFAVSGHIGGTNAWGGVAQRGIPALPLLGWGDLEDLVAAGASIGAHTRTHASLVGLPGDRLDAELAGCADDLERRLGVRTPHVAYPFGDVSDEVAARAAHRFGGGYTTEFDFLRAEAPPLRRPRLDMYYFRSPSAWAGWGGDAFVRRIRRIRLRREVRRRAEAFGRRVLGGGRIGR